MTIKRVISAAAVILVAISLPASAYALTAIFSTNPAHATISDRGIACEALDLAPVVSTISIPGPELFMPVFTAIAANATGHGAITAKLENQDGDKVEFINQPYDDESHSFAFIELLISSFNPKQEGPLEEKNHTVESPLRYVVSPGSFFTGAFVFTIRGLLSNAEVLLFGSASEGRPFRCSGAGMVEIRLPFSLRYE